ncbi:hypothetical protein ACHAXR_007200 [Thalassiosira sp. AJA248-18]
MLPHLSSLPRFPLSIILSYLQQPSCQNSSNLDGIGENSLPLPHNRDSISFLLTAKRLAYAILPLFRVPKHVCNNYQCQTKDGNLIAVVEKYRFVVLPIQDPLTLLDRLNTRRLRARVILMKQFEKEERHLELSEEDGTEDGVEIYFNHLDVSGNDSNAQGKMYKLCYQPGRTIEELAYEEWTMMEINHANSAQNVNGKNKQWRIWPAHLELLQFLENTSLLEQSKYGQRTTLKQKINVTSPFHFRALNNKQCRDSNEAIGGQLFGNEISLLASYPRSGNTLLRTLLERITSAVTGSDTRPDRTLSKSLALDHNLVGEGLVGPINQKHSKSISSLHLQNRYQSAYDPLVHIVKTHFPERKGWKPVKGNRVLLLVRNPYDAIDSYWNLCCTNTHTRTLDESVYTKYAQKFEGMARHEIQVWCDFHYYWIDICKKEGVPLLVVRYEDLVLDTEAEMLRVMKFLMGQHDVEDSQLTSFWKWRIHHAIEKTASKLSTEKTRTRSKPGTEENGQKATNTSNLGSYQPRSSEKGLLSLGKSIRKKRYSERVLCHMHEVAASLELSRKQNSYKHFAVTASDRQQHKTLLHQFGYDIYTQRFPENFKQPPALEVHDSGRRKGTVVINRTPEIRKKNDPFGRAMTFWRRGETDGDAKPFPTIPR